MDAIGNVPFVIALSEGLTRDERRKITYLAPVSAALIGLFFLFLGRFILNVLEISVGAFAIAGALVLLILSIHHISTGRLVETTREDTLAIVPIGTPLTVGPGTITTLLLMTTQFPLYLVLIAFMLNIIIVWITLLLADQIARILGQAGIKVLSRVAALLLAAIAVNMGLHGLQIVGVLPTGS